LFGVSCFILRLISACFFQQKTRDGFHDDIT
jgi:hypothetical protein